MLFLRASGHFLCLHDCGHRDSGAEEEAQALRAMDAPAAPADAPGAGAGGGVPNTLIGSTISLISKSDIRYEGVLYDVNLPESTMSLRSGACGPARAHGSPWSTAAARALLVLGLKCSVGRVTEVVVLAHAPCTAGGGPASGKSARGRSPGCGRRGGCNHAEQAATRAQQSRRTF